MASTPLRRRVTAALAERGAPRGLAPLDVVCEWLARGGSFVGLASSLSTQLARPNLSRRFVSFVAHRLAPDASTRIASARRTGGKFYRVPLSFNRERARVVNALREQINAKLAADGRLAPFRRRSPLAAQSTGTTLEPR